MPRTPADTSLRYEYVLLRYRHQSAHLTQQARAAALQAISAHETATYGMDTRRLPTREMVIRDGQPVWRVCGQGICIETGSGTKAQAEFEALCVSMGIDPPDGTAERGPCEVDEPGV